MCEMIKYGDLAVLEDLTQAAFGRELFLETEANMSAGGLQTGISQPWMSQSSAK